MNKPIAEVKAGDRVQYRADTPVCTVLRPAEQAREVHGGPCLRLWVTREDTGEEGFITYGPSASVQLA